MEKINFEDIRVGDRIEAHRVYSSGDLSVCRLTVQEKGTHYVASAEFVYTINTSAEYFLVERPKPTFKVGDTITGAQVADLPDGAVFDLNDGGVALRYKIDGVVYDQRVAGECLVSAGEHTIGPVSDTYGTPYISGLRTP